MLRISANKSTAGVTKYFDEGLSKSDYYSEKDEIIGKWGGKTAKYLGLKGKVSKKEFEQLTARNSYSRRVGYDFTFDVPKPVSIIYSQTKDKDIFNAFEKSINEPMIKLNKVIPQESEIRERMKIA